MVDIAALPARSFASALNLFRRKKTDRQYTRHACCIPGSISLAERGYDIEGLIVEISRGGMLFRPATRYILDRTGTEIIVTFATYKHAGRVVHTREFGYGIRLNTSLEQEDIDMILDEFGIQDQSV